jgi:uncharacterized OB-fold protein
LSNRGEKYLKIRGTRLSGKDFHDVLHFKDFPKFAYQWATGVAITRFFSGMKKGKIIGSFCDDCNKTMTPPLMFCYECYNPMVKYVEISDVGIINTFSIAYINTDATRREKPELPIVVDFDDTKNSTNTPSGFLHILDENTPLEKIKVGARVKAVWKDPNERIGDITDIKYFVLEDDI